MNFRWFLKSTFVGLALSSTIVVPSAYAQKGIAQGLSSANPRVGVQPTRIASGFQLQEVAQGSEPLENPSTKIKKFGFLADGTNTVPDENTYVVFDQNPGGRIAAYSGGTLNGRERMEEAVQRNVTLTEDGSAACVADKLLSLAERLSRTGDDALRAGAIAS